MGAAVVRRRGAGGGRVMDQLTGRRAGRVRVMKSGLRGAPAAAGLMALLSCVQESGRPHLVIFISLGNMCFQDYRLTLQALRLS